MYAGSDNCVSKSGTTTINGWPEVRSITTAALVAILTSPYELARVTTKLDVANVAPEVNDVEFRIKSALEVPTEPSAITVDASDFIHRNHAAVPDAPIVTLDIAAAVITPFVLLNAEEDGNVIVANNVWLVIAVSGVAGCEPV